MRHEITPDGQRTIIDWIELFDGPKIRWSDVVEASAELCAQPFSRQALEANSAIAAAYRRKKGRLKLARTGVVELLNKRDREAELRVEIAHLRQEVNTLLVRMVRWEYNAALQGWTTQLDAPLPESFRTTREASEKKITDMEARRAAKIATKRAQRDAREAKKAVRNTVRPAVTSISS
jgi:hypothetical protein